ncbi:hypothetical protein OW960_12930 [Klebsiella pneumoniae]|uniref:hypothetical protein n=3 Tax=Enterobacteriaceae TaxID=543 RepID=UPI002275158B
MSTYKTGNPLGSAAVKDLFDNAENLDFALNSLTALIWTDRLGKVRPSFFGMETSFLSQMASQESRFTSQLADQDTRFNTFIASSGYDIVGDYTVGTIPEGNPLTITEYNQLIRYNNELYKLTAATDIPFTASGKTDETWTTTDSAHFVSVGDAALRQNLGSNEGFSLIGQATYSQIRNFTGSGNSLMCCGAETHLDGAQGIFDQVPGGAVMTIPDDDCVHIRDPLGRLWKRRFEGNEIRMAWARAKSVKQTSAPQDFAFKNCLQAAASISESGYPQSIIKGLDVGVVYIAERHHIRCGNWPEYMAWKLPPGGAGNRFGIDMLCALDMGAGFFVVQANNPYFRIHVDNTGIDFNVDNFTDDEIAAMVNDNYILRLEAMVNAPDFDMHAGNYPGTVLYSTGKSDYSAVTAHWPDLVQVLPSIQNVGDVVFNIKSCGRDFYLVNTGAGLGHWNSIWSQNNRTYGLISRCYDLKMTFEDYVPHTETSGGLIFSECGTLSLSDILTGAGGIGHLCFWDCPNVTVGKHISICGAPTYAQSNPSLYALEVCNSNLFVSGVHAQNSGRFMRGGFNSRITFAHATAWYISKFFLGTNNLNLLKYRGQRASVVGDPVMLYINDGFLQQLNTPARGWPAEPSIELDETIGAGWEIYLNTENNDNHSGYDAEAEEKLALVAVKTTAAGTLNIGKRCKLEGNTTNYVIRLASKEQLGTVETRKTNFCRIRYTDDGSQSSFSLREAAHPLNGTVVGNGSTFQYPYRRPGRYFVSLTIPSSGGSCSVSKNGMPVFQTNVPGTHGILVDLKFQEQVLFTTTGGSGVTLTNPQWRFGLEA